MPCQELKQIINSCKSTALESFLINSINKYCDLCMSWQEYFLRVWITLMRIVRIKYQRWKGQTPRHCFKRRPEEQKQQHQHQLLNLKNVNILVSQNPFPSTICHSKMLNEGVNSICFCFFFFYYLGIQNVSK